MTTRQSRYISSKAQTFESHLARGVIPRELGSAYAIKHRNPPIILNRVYKQRNYGIDELQNKERMEWGGNE